MMMVAMMLLMLSIGPVETLMRWWTTKVRDHQFDNGLAVLPVCVDLKLLIKLQKVRSRITGWIHDLLQCQGGVMELLTWPHASSLDLLFHLSGGLDASDSLDLRLIELTRLVYLQLQE